jgi:hypothetical protein
MNFLTKKSGKYNYVFLTISGITKVFSFWFIPLHPINPNNLFKSQFRLTYSDTYSCLCTTAGNMDHEGL